MRKIDIILRGTLDLDALSALLSIAGYFAILQKIFKSLLEN